MSILNNINEPCYICSCVVTQLRQEQDQYEHFKVVCRRCGATNRTIGKCNPDYEKVKEFLYTPIGFT